MIVSEPPILLEPAPLPLARVRTLDARLMAPALALLALAAGWQGLTGSAMIPGPAHEIAVRTTAQPARFASHAPTPDPTPAALDADFAATTSGAAS